MNHDSKKEIFSKKLYYRRWWKGRKYGGPSRDRLFVLGEYARLVSSFSKSSSFILDAGCGSGAVLRMLRSRGCKNLIGIDLANTVDRSTFPRDQNVSFIVAETTHLPLRPESLDIIFARKFVSVSDVRRSLGEFYSVLKNDGKLVIDVPNVKRLKSRIYNLLGLTPPYPAKYFPRLHMAWIKRILDERNFTILQTKGDYVSIPFFGNLISRFKLGILQRALGHLRPDLCLHISAVCSKRVPKPKIEVN